MNLLIYIICLIKSYIDFLCILELEHQLHALDNVQENQTSDAPQKIRELEKAVRMIKQEKDEAMKVGIHYKINTNIKKERFAYFLMFVLKK